MINSMNSVWMAVAAGLMLAGPAQAQVRDAEYRGTVVCDNLPFAAGQNRAAILVKLTGTEGPYERTVHVSGGRRVAAKETGTVKVDGDKIALTGAWKDDKDAYDASYTGTFERRRAKLTGTQTWTHEGKNFTRNCSGAIERPLAAFLPKPTKPAQ